MNSQHMKIWVKGEGVVLSWEGSGEPAPYFLAGVSVSPAIKSGFVSKWIGPEMVGSGFKGDFAQVANGSLGSSINLLGDTVWAYGVAETNSFSQKTLFLPLWNLILSPSSLASNLTKRLDLDLLPIGRVTPRCYSPGGHQGPLRHSQTFVNQT